MVSAKATVDAVRVTPPGEASFEINVHGAPAVAYPPLEGSGDDAPVVDVGGAIRFFGRGERPTYALARATEAARGMARLAAGTRVEHVRARRGHAVADVVLGSTVRVQGVEVSCDALDLVEAKSDGIDFADGDVPMVIPRTKLLVLEDTPRGHGAVLRVRTDEPALLTLVDLGTQDGMTHVAFRSVLGSSFEGWTPRSALTTELRSVGLGLSGIGTGGCDVGEGTLSSNVYVGPATLHAGAPVWTRPHGVAWGVTATATVRVVHTTGEPYVRILDAPGIGPECGTLDHAFVDVGFVTMPRRHRR